MKINKNLINEDFLKDSESEIEDIEDDVLYTSKGEDTTPGIPTLAGRIRP